MLLRSIVILKFIGTFWNWLSWRNIISCLIWFRMIILVSIQYFLRLTYPTTKTDYAMVLTQSFQYRILRQVNSHMKPNTIVHILCTILTNTRIVHVFEQFNSIERTRNTQNEGRFWTSKSAIRPSRMWAWTGYSSAKPHICPKVSLKDRQWNTRFPSRCLNHQLIFVSDVNAARNKT